MTTLRGLLGAGVTALLAVSLAGCISSGGGSGGGGPVAAAPAVDGDWLSTDGVAVSRFAGGVFTTNALDTGNKLADGSYRMTGADSVQISGTSLIRQTPISFNCLLVAQNQLNCTSAGGQQFVLNRRNAV